MGICRTIPRAVSFVPTAAHREGQVMKVGLLLVAGAALLLLEGHREEPPIRVGRYSIKTWNVQLNADTTCFTKKAATLPMVVEIARSIYKELDSHREHFVVLFLDTKQRVFGYKVLFSGSTINCGVSTGEVFRQALLMGAHSVVVVHNHPSGDRIRVGKTGRSRKN
jgi:hypothetical protein